MVRYLYNTFIPPRPQQLYLITQYLLGFDFQLWEILHAVK
jgi:hypothetical protein